MSAFREKTEKSQTYGERCSFRPSLANNPTSNNFPLAGTLNIVTFCERFYGTFEAFNTSYPLSYACYVIAGSRRGHVRSTPIHRSIRQTRRRTRGHGESRGDSTTTFADCLNFPTPFVFSPCVRSFWVIVVPLVIVCLCDR